MYFILRLENYWLIFPVQRKKCKIEFPFFVRVQKTRVIPVEMMTLSRRSLNVTGFVGQAMKVLKIWSFRFENPFQNWFECIVRSRQLKTTANSNLMFFYIHHIIQFHFKIHISRWKFNKKLNTKFKVSINT